jgi:ribonucleoside-diphosphate reductase alpha chain
MFGVGVGFRPQRTGLILREPTQSYTHVVDDSREGWVNALRALLYAFESSRSIPEFDYSKVRPFGAPIKTFGGTASGPAPLKQMLDTMTDLCYEYCKGEFDEVRFKTDLANLVGVCVVAGNVRRSAEIGLAEMDDPVFHTLKDYKRYPYRAGWGWMSNNSVLLTEDDHFQNLDQIAVSNIDGHDVGFLNMRNVKYGRLGKRGDNFPIDTALGLNPCGEIPLENREVCNLAETLPTRCVDTERWLEACRYATFYCSTVTLLPTHQSSTNAVINRNRRIGVSLMDFTGWQDQIGTANVIAALRRGYNLVRDVNRGLAEEAGIPISIRVTTVKPGGTVPKMAGRQSGAGYPTFRHTLRRINIGVGTPVDRILIASGLPYEDSVYTPNTHVFEYPIEQGPARPATEVTLWEQAMNLVLLQREWADNAVSNTLYFKPKWSRVSTNGQVKVHGLVSGYSFTIDGNNLFYSDVDVNSGKYKVVNENGVLNLYRFNPNHEEDQIADVLSHIAPLVKSVSLLPHSDVGIFAQMPEEGISKSEYDKRIAKLKPIDWTSFSNSDGQDEKYCEGDHCVIS